MNDAPTRPPEEFAKETSSGHGMLSMRERAAMLEGGTLAVGPSGNGGFAVTAVLPSTESERASVFEF